MSGYDSVISSIKEGRIPRCTDGLPLEPLDYLFLLFPHKGPKLSTGINTCFEQKQFEIPALRKLFPYNRTKYFVPDDIIDSFICLLLVCCLLTLGIVTVRYMWDKYDPKFASISPSHKKWYVVANLSKAFLLAIITINHRYWRVFFQFVWYNQIHVLEVKRCVLLYIASDTVTTFLVPKLPQSTKFHHFAAITMSGIILMVDLDRTGTQDLVEVCRMAIIYASSGIFAYNVNCCLALRVAYPKATWLKWINRISLGMYLLCYACNWTIHIIWIVNLIINFRISVFSLVYITLLIPVVYSNMVLIKWWVHESYPMDHHESEEKPNQDMHT